jgi:hypothetical protein
LKVKSVEENERTRRKQRLRLDAVCTRRIGIIGYIGNGICKLLVEMTQTFTLKIYNGRIKVYCDGYVMFSFNQIDFLGYYAYKNDEMIYGLDIYLLRERAGKSRMDIYFKTKENWLAVLKLLDEKL